MKKFKSIENGFSINLYQWRLSSIEILGFHLYNKEISFWDKKVGYNEKRIYYKNSKQRKSWLDQYPQQSGWVRCSLCLNVIQSELFNRLPLWISTMNNWFILNDDFDKKKRVFAAVNLWFCFMTAAIPKLLQMQDCK